jgi:hypothetical protein
MTVDGIKNIKDVEINDLIYTLNPETHNIEIEKIIAKQINNTNLWYNFKSGKSVDFKVTPDHKMYFKKNNSNKFVKERADYFENKIGKKYGQILLAHHNPFITINDNTNVDLHNYIDEFHIIKGNCVKDGKHSKQKYFKTSYDMEYFSKFIGWYASEGSYAKNIKDIRGIECGQIRISQKKSVNIDNYLELIDMFEKMHINYNHDDTAFYFNSRLFLNFIKNEIGHNSSDKRLPKFVFNLPLKYIRNIFECMMKGDGNKNGNRYTTKSEKLKNDFLHLCFLIGVKTGSVYKDSNHCWRITIRKIKKVTCVKYKNISIENCNNELSYCLTTEKNHIIYAGQNNCFNWIGQCDNYHPENSHVIPGLIRRFHEAKENNIKDVICWGDGTPMREFLFSDDLADACIFLMNNYNDSDIVNIGTGKDMTIKELTEIIKNIVYPDANIIFNNDINLNGTPRKVLDTTKINTLGWYPKVSFEEGIKLAYGDFLRNL